MITQLRKPKIGRIAIFDVAATALVALGISYVGYSFIVVFICLIILGIIIHYMAGIPTAGNAYLGLNTWDEIRSI